MEAIKNLLGEQLFNSVVEKLGGKELFLHDKGQKVIVDDGSLIPKHRFDEVNEAKKTLSAQVEQADKDLKSLKSAAKGDEELTKQIEDLQTQRKNDRAEFDVNELKTRKSFAIKEALLNAGVGDVEARNLLSLKFGEIELNQDGTVKQFDKLLEPIRANKAFAGMFGETKIAGQGHGNGEDPAVTGKFYTREQIKGMSQKDVDANLDNVIKSMEHLGKSRKD